MPNPKALAIDWNPARITELIAEFEDPTFNRAFVASQIPVHPTTLDSWIRGDTDPGARQLGAMAGVLGVEVSAFYQRGNGR